MTDEIEQQVAGARAQLAARRYADAEHAFRAILKQRPQHAGALRGLGELALVAGQFDAAEGLLKSALEQAPDSIEILISLAQCADAKNDHETAEVFARLAVGLSPQSTAAHLALAHVLNATGRIGEVAPELLRVLELDPARSDVRIALARVQLAASPRVETRPPPPKVSYRLGRELERRGRRLDAAEFYRAALAQSPDLAAAAVDLAALHHQWDDLDGAVRLNRQALDSASNHAQAHHNLGLALMGLDHPEEALREFDAAQAFAPDSVLVGLNRAMLLLLLGRWDEGWKEYEWRWKLKRRARTPLAPPWDGSPLGEHTLLLFSELGLGDNIQMLRYLPPVLQRVSDATRILLACPEPLRRLFSRLPRVQLVQAGDPVVKIDYELPLCSLPRIFGTRPDTVPPVFNDLFVPERSSAADALREWPKPRIGLVWAGNPEHLNDANRSMAFGLLHPLINETRYVFVSLQKGAGEAELDRTPPARAVLDLAPELADMADTAAAIAELDLVISVDTGVAHLAGTLNKPVWLMLPFASEWRWLRETESTPWYPSMRIFRQRRRGDWPELVARMRAELGRRFPA
ncbi:MAG TPA: tetratricopeptide repeat protein [Pseudolabrys sp.]|nr:tetratricopeptide repeat protein [Pseudolabrys sp.]